MSKTKAPVKYKKNPFVGQLTIKKKSKQVSVTKMGKDDNVYFDQNTGEVKGTHVVSYKTVDSNEFVKVFTANIALTFNLTPAGQKIFNMLLRTLQKNAIGKDRVNLSSYELTEFNEDFGVSISASVLSRGISDLEKNQIIARTERQGTYFINPSFIFNGDRIAFTNAYKIK